MIRSGVVLFMGLMVLWPRISGAAKRGSSGWGCLGL